MTEREKIVRWLRARADAIETLAAEAKTEQSRRELQLMATARRVEADAIENGLHLTFKPTPTIPASEWRNTPSVG